MSSSSAASDGHKPLGALVKDDGTTVIASSRRPDGTWRKERRVRDGYVPQDEVVSYRPGDSRGQQQRQHPVGWDPSMATQQTKPSVKKKDGEKRANKKKAAGGGGGGGSGGGGCGGGGAGESTRANGRVDAVAECLRHVSLDEKGSGGGEVDPAKRSKALQKKLRQVDELVGKKRGGAELTAEQEEKLGRRQALVEEMAQVEQLITSAGGTPPPPQPTTSTPTPTPSHTHTNTSASSSAGDQDSAKRLKALRKKLKQIEDLEGRDVRTLSEEERGKVARKDEVLHEMQVLERAEA